MRKFLPYGRAQRQLPRLLLTVVLAFSAQARAQADQRHAQVLASPEWQGFVRLVQANHVTPAGTRGLDDACVRGLNAAPGAADESPVEACMRAAVKSLGGASVYLSPKEMAAMRQESSSAIGGVGLEMKAHAGDAAGIEIVAPIAASPADRAGLKPGDLVYAIDGVPTRTLSLAQSAMALRGAAGTTVVLSVGRRGDGTPSSVTMKREPVSLASVRVRRVSPETLFLRVRQFTASTRRELVAAMSAASSAGHAPPKNLVLDLRSCAGGLLESVVGVTALFVPPDTRVLSTKGRSAASTRDYGATPQDFARIPVAPGDAPVERELMSARLAILVDERTAAGAEAITQALKEQRKAVVVGQATFGSASIETLLALPGGAAVKLSTAVMYSPDGQSWGGAGIQPDIAMPAPSRLDFELGKLDTDAGLARAVKLLEAAGSKGP